MATVKLSTLFGYPQEYIIKAVNEGIISPFDDCADNTYTSANKQTIVAGTEYDFEANGLPYEKQNLPTHITKLWDKTLNKCYFNDVVDSPVYVCRVQLNFLPNTAQAGVMEFHAYIDEPVPVQIQTIRVAYKATDSKMEALFSFYVGEEEGYNIKENGMKFTYNASTNGKVYDRGILVYRT